MNDNLPDTASSKKKVLVLGGGFGGVFAAKALEKLGRGKLDVELINSNNYFVFQPLLPEVAASSRLGNCSAASRCARPRS